MQKYDLDIEVTRGAIAESRHRVHAAVVDSRDILVARARDSTMACPWRSCAKPFQVMPFLESGGFDELGWDDDRLALACASHGGEPEHVALAAAMLGSIGLEDGDLACGPHDPLSARGARILRETNDRPSRLHNNCSGKHAAMLAFAHTSGWETRGYEHERHPVQERAHSTVAHWAGVPTSDVGRAVDGCGVVVFTLPLEAMARAYARWAAAAARGDDVPARIVHAMRTRPHLVGGTERFDTALIDATGGNVIPKIGAEGIHSVAVLDQQLGVVVKVEDGAQRAQYPALLRLLQHLGALPDPVPASLAEYLRKPLRNTRGENIGEVVPPA